jgi:hypothetical protein
VLIDSPGLRVTVGSPHYLLALKLAASRVERDEDDIRVLLELCGIGTVDGALDVLTAAFGSRPIEPRVQYLLAEILGE